MQDSLTVDLANRSYPIHIGSGLAGVIAEAVSELRSQNRPVAVVTDACVAAAQPGFQEVAFAGVPLLSLPAGETTKSFAQLEATLDFLAAQRVDRSGVLFAWGGGVIGDLGGFAAASYLRGIDFHQVPTTLLAMVDSSVGGKTGINLRAGKNLVGAFYQPKAVWVDMEMLQTLPAREFNAGMAEVLKYGLLADAELWEELSLLDRLHPGHVRLPGIIRRCCAIKAAIVKADEQERAASGGRALLNLGHTFAHAVEAVAGYGNYLHGEAVGLGLVMAAELSRQLGHLQTAEVEAVRQLVERYDLPVCLREPLSVEALMQAMARDKKVRQGSLRFVVMERLGQAITDSRIEAERVRAIWQDFGASA